jgi:hypothetical protein
MIYGFFKLPDAGLVLLSFHFKGFPAANWRRCHAAAAENVFWKPEAAKRFSEVERLQQMLTNMQISVSSSVSDKRRPCGNLPGGGCRVKV